MLSAQCVGGLTQYDPTVTRRHRDRPMEEEDDDQCDAIQIYCCRYKLPSRKQWVLLYSAGGSGLRCLLHVTSVLVDVTLACQLAWAEQQPQSAAATLVFIYLPAVFTFILQPPDPPEELTFTEVSGWVLYLIACVGIEPIVVSVRLFKHLVWIIRSIHAKKPLQEILHAYESTLPKEVHSYLFLQAFLQCAPQAIFQMQLLILGVTSHSFTGVLQFMSIVIALTTVAKCVATFQRYEAQVTAGRSPVLMLSPPELTESDVAIPLVPIQNCLHGKLIGLENDYALGKVVAFFAWFLLIFGRLLCIIVSYEMHPTVTAVTLFSHVTAMLLYSLSSQKSTLLNLPYKFANALVSLIALVEVSVRFHKIPLLYTLFFVCLFVEDTYLLIFFFLYRSDNCGDNRLTCKHLAVYSYLIINSHVIGVLCYGIYLAWLRPRSQTLTTAELAREATG